MIYFLDNLQFVRFPLQTWDKLWNVRTCFMKSTLEIKFISFKLFNHFIQSSFHFKIYFLFFINQKFHYMCVRLDLLLFFLGNIFLYVNKYYISPAWNLHSIFVSNICWWKFLFSTQAFLLIYDVPCNIPIQLADRPIRNCELYVFRTTENINFFHWGSFMVFYCQECWLVCHFCPLWIFLWNGEADH